MAGPEWPQKTAGIVQVRDGWQGSQWRELGRRDVDSSRVSSAGWPDRTVRGWHMERRGAAEVRNDP